MNEQIPTPPGNPSEPAPITPAASTPPLIPSSTSTLYPGATPLGSNAIERMPIAGPFAVVDALLRQPRRMMFQLTRPNPGGLVMSLLGITIVCSLIYGVVVGTFSGGAQMWAAPTKIVAGLLISALICLPSLYIFSCLGGSRARLVEMFGLVAGLMALMAMLLLGFAPVAWLFSQSTKSLAAMGSLHLAFWLVATGFGLRFLYAGFSHFSTNSSMGIKVWTGIFLLVVLQMTTAMRPILGTAKTFMPAPEDKMFFVTHWMNCVNDETKTTPGPAADARY